MGMGEEGKQKEEGEAQTLIVASFHAGLLLI